MRLPMLIWGVGAMIYVGGVCLGIPTPVWAEEVAEDRAQARVTQVQTQGEPQDYRFRVTIESPDTGCDRYADWWEVITPEGELIYRRILAHSHVEEQPFTRSGGAVAIDPQQTVIVRAHLHPDGYGDQGMEGTVEAGFISVELSPELGVDLAQQPPLPSGCTF